MNEYLINNYFNSLGFSERETTLYFFLLKKQQPITILKLSQLTGIARTTVHQNIESLIEKGLVSEMIIRNKRVVRAERPFVLYTLLGRKELQLKKQSLELNSLQKELPRLLEKLESQVLAI
ncbi:MAG TPA: helix-turn-helix domain-containing protein [Vitreimonas sp.]|nr:helix-turn-helix domain-containing protein [Vitreimonas sp.]